MSHHTEATVHDDAGGFEVEKWILRALLVAVLAMTSAAVIGSLDDIKRYIKISRM